MTAKVSTRLFTLPVAKRATFPTMELVFTITLAILTASLAVYVVSLTEKTAMPKRTVHVSFPPRILTSETRTEDET